MNVKSVERIWLRERLKVPQKQPKKARFWLNDGSCIRLRPKHPNHVWSYEFVEGRTHNGRKFRMLNIIDEFTRKCLSIRIECTDDMRLRNFCIPQPRRPINEVEHNRRAGGRGAVHGCIFFWLRSKSGVVYHRSHKGSERPMVDNDKLKGMREAIKEWVFMVAVNAVLLGSGMLPHGIWMLGFY